MRAKVPSDWNGLVPPAVPVEWNAVTERIIRAAMEVHTILGPGLVERLYEDAVCYELQNAGLHLRRQVPISISYKTIKLEGQRVDLLINDLVIVELKAVEAVSDVDLAQLVSYMRSGRIPLGLLINFNTARLKDGVFRRVLSKYTPLPEPFLSDSSPRSSAISAPSAFA